MPETLAFGAALTVSKFPHWVWDLFQAFGAVGTIIAALVAWYQIGELRNQNKGWNTLERCNMYDTDPILDMALRSLRVAMRKGRLNRGVQVDAVTVLNYLDGTAVGVFQGFYVEETVRKHLESVMRGHWAELVMVDGIANIMDYSPSDWQALADLLKLWDNSANSRFSWRSLLGDSA